MLPRALFGRVVGVCLLVWFVSAARSGIGSGQAVGNPSVKLNFTNQSGSPVALFQATPQGETTLGVVKEGETRTVTTTVGRTWILRDGSKTELGRYTAGIAREVSIVLGPSSSPGTAPAAGVPLTAEEAADLVRFHNRVREEVGVGPVKWSPELAGFAQAWADELARTGTFQHRSQEPGPWQQKYGENLAYFQGDVAVSVVLKGAEIWYAEKKAYTPGTPIPMDFSTFHAGHYTQMVWRETTEIGAARATIRTGNLKGAQVLVCNYNPPGNFVGKTPY